MADKYSTGKDLKEAVAMADALVPYVHQGELYGSTGGGFFSTMPRMTIGGLLLRLRRLDALRDQLDASGQEQLDKARARNEEVFRTWRDHYEGKMQREALSRLNAMNTFFEECRANPHLCPTIYQPEATRRTVVEELIGALKAAKVETAEIEAKAKSIDGQLRGVVQTSDFIWDAVLEPIYPKGAFWWLYHAPPARNRR